MGLVGQHAHGVDRHPLALHVACLQQPQCWCTACFWLRGFRLLLLGGLLSGYLVCGKFLISSAMPPLPSAMLALRAALARLPA